jgi:quercetin dioxygenase-like cupin family protein
MPDRTPDLRHFLDLTLGAIAGRAAAGGPAATVSERIGTALRRPAGTGTATMAERPSACRHLDAALAAARQGAPDIAEVADAVGSLAGRLIWTRRPGSESVADGFYDNHASARVTGPDGLEIRDDVSVGLSLMAPNTRYPDHHHPPEEVYLVLSPGEWRQGDGPWHEPGPGGVVHNPPGIVHAMRSGDSPLLAVWCLWREAGA